MSHAAMQAAIDAWFHAHNDGEFSVGTAASYSGDFAHARSVVSITKPACWPRIQPMLDVPQPVAVLGQYGLPGAAELAVLRTSASRLFIGDLDPPHLLAYAWLKANRRRCRW